MWNVKNKIKNKQTRNRLADTEDTLMTVRGGLGGKREGSKQYELVVTEGHRDVT